MDFDLTEDQKEIKRVAHELLASRSPWPKVRQAAESGEYDDALWRELVALGWPGIAVAEEHGGQGLGMVELAVLAEELGYACAAVPFLSTGAVAAALSVDAGARGDGASATLLPNLVSGARRAGFGTRALAVDAVEAHAVVLLEGEGAVLLEDFGVEEFIAIDSTRRYATISPTGEGEQLESGAADRIRIVLAAEVLGICQRALEMTLEFVKERKQFGVAVGSFQAVSHRCAEMLLQTESVRSVTLFAAWAADAEPERLSEAAALAAAAATQAGREVTASAIQAHGGIGFTWEADVHWLLKRAQLDAALLGGAQGHRARLARLAAERVAASAVPMQAAGQPAP